MTTAELIARYRATVAYDLDSVLGPIPDPSDAVAGAAFDAGVVGYLNEGALALAKLVYLTDPAVVLTLAPGVARYALGGPAFSSRVLIPYSVVVGGVRLRTAAGNDYGIWAAWELSRQCPTWMADAPGTPTKAAIVGADLLLHPAPSAAGTAYVDARIAPASLSTSSLDDVPALPEELHPAIVQMAVYRSCSPYCQTTVQIARLNAMLAEANALAEATSRELAALRVGDASTRFADRQERMWV